MLEFYNIDLKCIIANKLKNYAPIKIINNFQVYGTFNQINNIFIIDELLNANYGSYIFNGVTYYCYIEDIKSTANGLYQYTFTVDPLSTVYYNGGFNSPNLISRCGNGSNRLIDDLLKYQSIPEITQYFLTENADNIYLVLTVLSGGAIVRNNPLQNYTQNPAYNYYALTPGQFIDMCGQVYQWDDSDQAKFVPSIIKINIVDSSDITDVNSTTVSGAVELRYINQSTSMFENKLFPELTEDTKSITFLDPIKIIKPLSKDTLIYKTIPDFTATSNDTLHLCDEYLLNIRNMGQIKFRSADINVNAINSVGYAKAIDFAGSQQIAYLTINGNILYNYKLIAPIPESAPFMFDTSVTNWTSIVSSSLVAIASLGAGLATGGVGLAAGLGVAGGQVSNLVGNVQQAMNGTSSTVGAVGGSVDRASDTPTVLIRWRKNIVGTLNEHIERYGLPLNEIKPLNFATGYLQATDCKIKIKNLPQSIIQQAEQDINNGVFIV